MLKQPCNNSSILNISDFQDRPNRGHKICLKRILKYFQKSYKICSNKKGLKIISLKIEKLTTQPPQLDIGRTYFSNIF